MLVTTGLSSLPWQSEHWLERAFQQRGDMQEPQNVGALGTQDRKAARAGGSENSNDPKTVGGDRS